MKDKDYILIDANQLQLMIDKIRSSLSVYTDRRMVHKYYAEFLKNINKGE